MGTPQASRLPYPRRCRSRRWALHMCDVHAEVQRAVRTRRRGAERRSVSPHMQALCDAVKRAMGAAHPLATGPNLSPAPRAGCRPSTFVLKHLRVGSAEPAGRQRSRGPGARRSRGRGSCPRPGCMAIARSVATLPPSRKRAALGTLRLPASSCACCLAFARLAASLSGCEQPSLACATLPRHCLIKPSTAIAKRHSCVHLQSSRRSRGRFGG